MTLLRCHFKKLTHLPENSEKGIKCLMPSLPSSISTLSLSLLIFVCIFPLSLSHVSASTPSCFPSVIISDAFGSLPQIPLFRLSFSPSFSHSHSSANSSFSFNFPILPLPPLPSSHVRSLISFPLYLISFLSNAFGSLPQIPLFWLSFSPSFFRSHSSANSSFSFNFLILPLPRLLSSHVLYLYNFSRILSLSYSLSFSIYLVYYSSLFIFPEKIPSLALYSLHFTLPLTIFLSQLPNFSSHSLFLFPFLLLSFLCSLNFLSYF